MKIPKAIELAIIVISIIVIVIGGVFLAMVPVHTSHTTAPTSYSTSTNTSTSTSSSSSSSGHVWA